MAEITRYKLDTAFAQLIDFDHCGKPDDFIEVSLWHNGSRDVLARWDHHALPVPQKEVQ